VSVGDEVQAREDPRWRCVLYPHLWKRGVISEVLVNGYEVTLADGTPQVFLAEEVEPLQEEENQ
jgi:hypothetical protein